MDRLKVKDNQDLERDVKSNGIVNTNRQVSREIKKEDRIDRYQRERDKLRDVTREVNEIKCEI